MQLEIELRGSLEGLDAAAWNRLVGAHDPFVEHAFLLALERSASVGAEAGWVPVHVTAYAEGELVGALPLYAKDNSWGEFIFDFGWASAAQSAGVAYYPKLVSMAPFTPATGRRFLVHPDMPYEPMVRALLAGAQQAAAVTKSSSVHLLFLSEAERDIAVEAGFLARRSLQFHWDNDGYRDFDDYLSRFRADKRKQVKKERRAVAESGLRVVTKSGDALSDEDWDAIKRFYRVNCLRHGSYPYLREGFFEEIRGAHAARVVAVLAYQPCGAPVAASFNLQKGERLYGRYWGASEEHDFLHFELCYYALIERAIAQRLRHFEAGAQGLHKLKRGLLPTAVHSAHWLVEPRLQYGVAAFLDQEACEVDREIKDLMGRSPFRRG